MQNNHITKLLLEHVSYYENVELERIVGDCGRELRRILIPAQLSRDKSRTIRVRNVYRYPEVGKVIFYANNGSGVVLSEPRIVALVRDLHWVEPFGIHLARIHQKIVQDTITSRGDERIAFKERSRTYR